MPKEFPGYRHVDFDENRKAAEAAEAAAAAKAETAASEPESSVEKPRSASEVGRERWAAAGKAVSGTWNSMTKTFGGWGDRLKGIGARARSMGAEALAIAAAPDKLVDQGARALNDGMNRILDPIEAGVREKAGQFISWKDRMGEKIVSVSRKTAEAVAGAGKAAWNGSVEGAARAAGRIKDGYETVASFGRDQVARLGAEMAARKHAHEERRNSIQLRHLESMAQYHEGEGQRFREMIARKVALKAAFEAPQAFKMAA